MAGKSQALYSKTRKRVDARGQHIDTIHTAHYRSIVADSDPEYQARLAERAQRIREWKAIREKMKPHPHTVKSRIERAALVAKLNKVKASETLPDFKDPNPPPKPKPSRKRT